MAELAEFAGGRAGELREHVEGCRRCAALVRHMDAERILAPDRGDVPTFAWEPPERGDTGEERFGDVCIASSPREPETLLVCVVLDWQHDPATGTVEVAPVATEVAMASDVDVVLDAVAPLGYPALVEVWNHGTLVRSQIGERLGRLPDEACAAVDAVYRALLGEGDTDALRAARHGAAIEADEDPRAAFQESEAERVATYWVPAARLYSEVGPIDQAATVGTLLSGWLESGKRDVAEYARELGWSQQEVALLSGDAFEPLAMEPERVGFALARTGASAADFEAALRRSIAIEQFKAPVPSHDRKAPPVFARPVRRKRLGAARRKPSEFRRVEQDPAHQYERYVQRAVRAFEDASKD